MNILLAIALVVGVAINAVVLGVLYMADQLPWSTRRSRRKALTHLIRYTQSKNPTSASTPVDEQVTQWEQLRMPTPRKHALIQARIAPAQAQSPNVKSLTVEEIKALAALLPTT
jgi:hypothetical protein